MSRYLITFDMDTSCLKESYHGNNYNNAYYDIKSILSKNGFDNIQGSVYLGNEGISEAHGTIAIQELAIRFNWFSECISNIKFYRLESDLNAQFIVDGVNKAKQKFNERLELLRTSLLQTGLSETQVQKILAEQTLSLEQLDNTSK